MNSKSCSFDVGCEETGKCYARSQGLPEKCGREGFEPNDRVVWIQFDGKEAKGTYAGVSPVKGQSVVLKDGSDFTIHIVSSKLSRE